jgi:hypothetical protein
MKRFVCLFALVVLVAASPSVASEAEGADQVARVSILELIATPRVWDGRLVRVQGFCHIEFEETALYLHREDSDFRNSLNAVWLDIHHGKYGEFNERPVIVEGRFTLGTDDHVGNWRGIIRDVSKVVIVPSRSETE